ncbi:hypothetical protein Golomagni_02830 [Golovinomyces magnicellulatus]|nr:hypothetical protein Golomagni_02830 [Golovinomyces magnicellulatus]
MEIDWIAEEAKWAHGFDTKNASGEEVNSYILTKIHSYEKYNTINTNLWEQVQEDFKNLSVETFKLATLRIIQNLRDCLLSRGVFVNRNDKRKTTAQTFCECIFQDEQHQWTDDDIVQAVHRLDLSLKSPKLNRRLEHIN